MTSSISCVVAEEVVVPPAPAPAPSSDLTKESAAEALEGKESLVLESQLKLAVEVHRQRNTHGIL